LCFNATTAFLLLNMTIETIVSKIGFNATTAFLLLSRWRR